MRQRFTQAGQVEQQAVKLMDEKAIPLLRVSLAITYLWFGLLKIIGKSPVSGMVARTAFFLPRQFVVPFMGIWEMAIGLGLLFRFPLRLTLVAYFAQLAGTFMVLIVRPKEAFQKKNPLLLTKEGEFVIKNLVLASAGLVVGSKMGDESERINNPAVAPGEGE